MRIAINLFLTSPKSATGAFVYIQQLLPALFKAGPEHTFYLLGERESVEYFESLYGNLPNVRFHAFGITAKKLWAKIRRDHAARESLTAAEVSMYLRAEGINVYFSPATLYPRGLGGIKIVATIHDLQPDYFPEHFSPEYLKQRKEATAYAVAHGSRLIAISQFTKHSLVEKYNADPQKVSVIYHAAQAIKSRGAGIELPKEFVFYPAALWPHKNHRVLIKALAILKDRFPALCAVCTGMIKGGNFKKELELLAEQEGVGARVLFWGYVPDGTLYSLYTRAKALVFPSAFEGFGIPLAEAFQLGLPVIAADNSSITEVVGDAGMLVKTGNAQALAGAIEKVLTDDILRSALIQRGRERAKLFSWDKAAEETLEVFRQSVSDSKQ